MKYISRNIMILTALCIITGCSSPLGIIEGGSGSSPNSGALDFNSMWVIPSRQLYNYEDFHDHFLRSSDLQIFIASGGLVGNLDTGNEDVIITITETLNSSTVEYAVGDDMYNFKNPGRKVVGVYYQDMSANYSIEVRGLSVGGEVGDGGVEIIWL